MFVTEYKEGGWTRTVQPPIISKPKRNGRKLRKVNGFNLFDDFPGMKRMKSGTGQPDNGLWDYKDGT